MDKLPKITKDFKKYIEEKAKIGNYSIKFGELKILVFPYVFPPKSAFSQSSQTLIKSFCNLSGQTVLDLGTGTGIQALCAAKAGATKVIASDIEKNALNCARKNIKINKLQDIIEVIESDLFEKIPKVGFDLIIANLPIIDFNEPNPKFHSLSDPNYRLHINLFQNAAKYLNRNGKIRLIHANLEGNKAFKKLENLASNNAYIYDILEESRALGYIWRNYCFKLK